MLFNSLQFLVFFPVVTLLYFTLPQKYRNLMLLAASTIFYMAFVPAYIFILASLIAIDFTCGILIENSPVQKKRRYLILSIAATSLMLFVFKYFNFFVNNVSFVTHLFHVDCSPPLLNILLPLGLSFHTFQSLSYIIEVYRGNQKAERNLLIYALYVMFYPQLVAGPIERPQNLLKQFYEKHTIDYVRITNGLKLMTYGLFKKVVVADRLAAFVDKAYLSPQQYAGVPMIIATVFFGVQIYCDFSGYTDIARGSAEVMGFRLKHNFRQPYLSESISDFWKRWHISLTSWFKDYVYVPLGGSKVSDIRHYFNVFLVFLVSGLWHGANWNFIVWGVLNAFYYIFASLTINFRKKIVTLSGIYKAEFFYRLIRVLTTFSLITFSWIFFRAKNISEAFLIIRGLFVNIQNIVDSSYLTSVINEIGISVTNVVIAVLSIVFVTGVDIVQRHHDIRELFSKRKPVLRWSVYYAAVLSIVFLGVFTKRHFIYFSF
ncbi:MAG: MBOAT family protein [Nitrospirae bacterium]|nr:MBOAT family protein [Nitrospirota bacterium]MBF0533896.1 MBOAT family protein [Nitrospirota bacterium]MBF0615395.1 MBOAT family protein [Nitrospirota bacterium]